MKTETLMKTMDGDLDRCRPGEPARMDAIAPGQGVWQGDLGLKVVEEPPADYEPVDSLTDADAQLVPGNTQGARHRLSSLDGVTMWKPRGWGTAETDQSLAGPCFRTEQEVTVLHPTHGPVVVPAGMTILCGYQREFDSEQQRERRNAD